MRFIFICILFRYSAFGIFGAQRAKAQDYVLNSESVASKRRQKTGTTNRLSGSRRGIELPSLTAEPF
jgi:hypothetical protein